MKKTLPVLLICVLVGIGVLIIGKNNEPQSPASRAAGAGSSPVDLAATKAKAEAGDPAAQTSLGWIYQKGTGVKPDMKEAVKWFKLAADQNYPDALAALGEMIQAGQGVKADPAEAVRLYRIAAEKGSVAGQYNLAYLYEQGNVVTNDEVEAAKWYELAAEGGDPYAQFDIGQRYVLGIGVKADHVQAFKWLTLAAAQGQSDSVQKLRDLKVTMSSEDLAAGKKLVQEFVPRKVSQSGQLAN